jgi:glycosyltransferase involved in cell wall biosynthesis
VPDAPTISVVICAYTRARWDELIEAVASTLTQTVAALEVIVVVDHNPELFERAREELDGARVLESTGSPGLAGARNTGAAAAAAADVIAFLDDDASAATDWLEQLASEYDGANVLGVGGRIDPLWQAPRPVWFPEEFNWVVGCSYRGLPTQRAAVRNMIGANMSVRREVLEAIGGFREELGRLRSGAGAAEETDLCIRGSERFPGGVWLYVPAAVVGHSVGLERTTWAFFRRRCFHEGLAKAALVSGTGASAGLESERRYVRRVLPAGVARGLLGSLRGQREDARRAAAIVVGLGYTAAGYVRGRVRQRMARPSA